MMQGQIKIGNGINCDIISGKVHIKVHPKQNIHAKIYIFREKVKHDHGYASVITGSSNLTDAGLGKNFEFNVELRDNTDIEFAIKPSSNFGKNLCLLTQNMLRNSKKIPTSMTHTQKRVILISATPLNYKPEDIANLVYLF